jgi:hypothetical protein
MDREKLDVEKLKLNRKNAAADAVFFLLLDACGGLVRERG